MRSVTPLPLSAPDQNIFLRVLDQDTRFTPSSNISNPHVIDPADDIFREALEIHKQSLSPEQQQAFLGASGIGLLDIVKQLDQQHSEGSRTRKSVMRVQGFLQVVDVYLNALVILVQHSPEYSSLVVGGLRYFLDVSCAACSS